MSTDPTTGDTIRLDKYKSSAKLLLWCKEVSHLSSIDEKITLDVLTTFFKDDLLNI